jgi:hypothetical protein
MISKMITNVELGRVAEWFKAPVLKFAFTRFVQSSPIPRDVSLSTMTGLFILAGVGVVRVVLERNVRIGRLLGRTHTTG